MDYVRHKTKQTFRLSCDDETKVENMQNMQKSFALLSISIPFEEGRLTVVLTGCVNNQTISSQSNKYFKLLDIDKKVKSRLKIGWKYVENRFKKGLKP